MRALVLCVAVSLMVVSRAAGECQDATKPVTEMGLRIADLRELSAAQREETISHQGVGVAAVTYLRVQVEAEGGAGPWYLTVRDANYHIVQVFDGNSFARSPRRWTARIPGTIARFDLDVPTGSPVKVRLKDYIAMPASATTPFYSSQDPNHRTFKPLYAGATDAAVRRLGDMVGFLMSSWGQTAWCCSGALIAPDLFLTNWHCGGPEGHPIAQQWSDQICANTLIDLSWDDDKLSREYQCKEVLAKDEILDVAILRVTSVAGDGAARPAMISTAPAQPGPVVVVHHPACQQKQVTVGCRALSTDYKNWRDATRTTDLTHDCDTERGSSGSPVFDAGGRLVGVHHLGFEFDNACNPITRENKAVRIEDVLAFLRGDPKYAAIVAELHLP